MDIGTTIRNLRLQRGITQEEFASALSVSVQTISRWENSVNCPDLSFIPLIASFFNVTTDFLFGMEGDSNMAKLLKTVETLEVGNKKEAEEMAMKFKGDKFPILKDYKITEIDGKTILEVTKEFNVDVDKMKFE